MSIQNAPRHPGLFHRPSGASIAPAFSGLIAFAALTLTFAAAPRAAWAQYAATVLADKPIAYYRFDDAAGANTIANSASSGALNDGVVHADPSHLLQYRQPGALTAADPTGTSLGFTGEYVTIPRLVQDDFTIEFFFRATAPGVGTGLGQFYDGSGLINGDVPLTRDDFGTALSAGRVLFGVGNVPGNHDLTVRSPAGFNDGKWHLVDAVRTRATGGIELFIDGRSVAAATGGTQPLDAAAELQIGKIASDYGSNGSQTNAFEGNLDEVALYPAALTADQIARHYLAATTPLPPGKTPIATDNGALGNLRVTLAHRVTGHSDNVNSVAFSPDGLSLASGARDQTVRLWDVATGAQKQILGKHDKYVSCVAFSPDGQSVFSGGWDNKIKQWKIGTPFTDISGGKFDKHQSYVLSLSFDPDGQHLASGSNDKTARVFAAATGASSVTATLPDGVASVVYSPSGARLAGACLDGKVYVWDAASLKLLHRLVAPNAPASQQFAAVFLDNDTLAAAGKDGKIRVWALHSNTLLATLSTDEHEVYSLAYDANRRLLAGGGADHQVHFWSVHSVKLAKGGNVAPLLTIPSQGNTVRAVSFSPDGGLLASGSWDFNIYLWQLNTDGSGDRLIVDPLDDMSKIFQRSPNWTVDTATPALFANDPARLRRSTGNTTEYLVYHVAGLRAFEARVYLQGTTGTDLDVASKVIVYASADNITYKAITYTHDTPVSSDLTAPWLRTVIQSTLPAGTNYLKIAFTNDDKTGSPELSEVRLVEPGGTF